MLNNIYQVIMQFLFPSHCPSCNAYVEQKGMWCSSCLEEIIRNENLAYDDHEFDGDDIDEIDDDDEGTPVFVVWLGS